jgi:hypothetical protein
MLKKDYILRLYDEFGKVMAVILSLKKDGDWERFEKEIRNALFRFTSLEINDVQELNAENFSKTVLNGNISSERQKILADLLFEKLNYYVAIDDRGNYLNLKNKCSMLYSHLLENATQNEFDLDVHYKLEFLKRV